MSVIEEKSWEDERFPVNRDDLVSVDPKTGAVTSPPMTASQEIRARALECAARIWTSPDWARETAEGFWADVREFEAYIRDGR